MPDLLICDVSRGLLDPSKKKTAASRCSLQQALILIIETATEEEQDKIVNHTTRCFL